MNGCDYMDNNKSHTFYLWGDSVLKGVIFDEARSRYSLLKNNCTSMFSKLTGIKIINRAKMGYTVGKGLELLINDLKGDVNCEAALLEFGGNDCDFQWEEISKNPDTAHQPKTSLTDFRVDIKKMINLLREKNITPVLVNLPPIDSDKYFDFISKGLNPQNILHWLGEKKYIYNWHEQYSVSIEQIATECDCNIIDIRSSFMIQPEYSSYLCVDGIHPNEKGHNLIREVFLNYANSIPSLNLIS